ncbi:MAG: hypothetical protein JO368_04675, partial [Acidimicrobiales bacterium]|nr:hypothetical protein [Acidimicrobiales bacterium]
MSEHVHLHTPEDEGSGTHSLSGRERVYELVAAVLLSLATVGIAWSGYQAAKWSGLQSRYYAQATTARSEPNRASVAASQDREQDLLNFNRWLEVSTAGNQTLADLYRRRFRDEFLPAFLAWQDQDPLHNVNAVASPLEMPEYKLANAEKADALELVGDQRFTQGKDATDHTDAYVLTTVFFAAVLFFAGISARFDWMGVRTVVLLIAAVGLSYSFFRLFTLPHV